MSKNQLINLISTRPGFKIDVQIAKLSKRELKDFIYYNYGYLSSKTKDELTDNSSKKYVISKYHKQNKPASMLEPI